MDLLNPVRAGWGSGPRRAGTLVLVVAWTLSPVAAAQLFSPGKLAAGHSPWEGLRNCDRCHSGAEQVDPLRCLACHEPLARRVKAKAGYHGRSPERRVRCEACHTDHKGTGAAMVVWPKGGESKFEHGETGWPLKGAHKGLDCKVCHDPRLLQAAAPRKWLREHPGAKTYLGLGTACKDCHFDEHRGQLSERCETCHGEQSWDPAPGFDHSKVWPLEGAHARKGCPDCHKEESDSKTPAGAFPKPRSPRFLRMKPVPNERCTRCHEDPHADRFGSACRDCHGMESWLVERAPAKGTQFHDKTTFPLRGKHRVQGCVECHPRQADGKMRLAPIPHARCLDCHADPHEGRFGADCQRCHDERSWAVQSVPAAKLEFHDKTTFPLRGLHRRVDCDACHPRGKGGARKLKPIAHERCTDCHRTPHPELGAAEDPTNRCDRCHDEEGFAPSSYGLAEHDAGPYPLAGAHRAVACPICHSGPLAAGRPAPPAQGARPRGETAWRLRASGTPPLPDCRGCHETAHRDQFPDRDCRDCHDTASWAPSPAFDHAQSFALTGAHAPAPCASCHRPEQDAQGTFVRLRPLPKDCAGCHRDVHLGQFQAPPASPACAECHDDRAWAPAHYDHQDLARGAWPLQGAHSRAPCEACHPRLQVLTDLAATRYRGSPRDCDACHEDPHRGSYQAMAPLRQAAAVAGAPARTDCAACHQEQAWRPARFDHDATGFPLRGLHEGLGCAECHHEEEGALPPPRDCAGCHDAPHGRRLGWACADCHDEEGFVDAPRALALHNRSSFPLQGRHGAIPCTECHRDLRDLGFDRTPRRCEACHADEAPRAEPGRLDHTELTAECGDCHEPLDWSLGAFLEHQRCFPIVWGPHAGHRCADCHERVLPPRIESCASDTARCTRCHGCEQGRHEGVAGYQCKDPKCYQCHPSGGSN